MPAHCCAESQASVFAAAVLLLCGTAVVASCTSIHRSQSDDGALTRDSVATEPRRLEGFSLEIASTDTLSKLDQPPVGAPHTEWATGAGGEQLETLISIASDPNGGIYITGAFQGTALFGKTILRSHGGYDLYAAKLSGNGDFVWAAAAGGGGSDGSRAIVADASGASFITGHFAGQATFGKKTLTVPTGGNGAFVARIGPTGVFEWAFSLDAEDGEGSGIGTSANGELFVSGSYANNATFGPFHLQGTGGRNVFAASFTPNGTAKWALSSMGSGFADAMAARFDPAGGLCIGGHFYGHVVFGGVPHSAKGDRDAFVTRVSPGGVFLWSASGGGTGQDNVFGVGADPIHCYVAGYFNGPATFGTTTLSPPGQNSFVARAGPAGFNLGLAATAQGLGVGTGVAPGDAGQIYFAGQFQNALSLGSLSAKGGTGLTNAFVARISPSGTPNWLLGTTGTHLAGAGPLSWNAPGHITIGGGFWATANFGSYSLNSRGSQDAFVWSVVEQWSPE